MSVVNIRVSATRGNQVISAGDFSCEIAAERFYNSLSLRYGWDNTVTVSFMVSAGKVAA